MKRTDAINCIRAYCAEAGRINGRALRVYVENRVSYAAFQKAAAEGIAIADRRAKKDSVREFSARVDTLLRKV